MTRSAVTPWEFGHPGALLIIGQLCVELRCVYSRWRSGCILRKNGRSDRLRTCDVLLPQHVLYQAELRSDEVGVTVAEPTAGAITI